MCIYIYLYVVLQIFGVEASGFRFGGQGVGLDGVLVRPRHPASGLSGKPSYKT